MYKRIVKTVADRFGYSITRNGFGHSAPPEYDECVNNIFAEVKPYTMTSLECVAALVNTVQYVNNNNVTGDFVECGVWKGGSVMAMARMLKNANVYRDFYLYDTFEGMSEPTLEDTDFRGRSAAEQLAADNSKAGVVWALSPLEEVVKNVSSVGYDMNRIRFVEGKVEETIPATVPESIAILRLDTDWYESTYHELVHLYPKLVVGGVLIIDDYGHWQGARKAVDQYFEENNLKLLLNRIDYTGRIAIKVE